ncbi:hypothetical protein BGW36DRAFT_137777 [Talaromyces proteolyticus]|uniref:Inner kinetochore subunit AME1 domain-containing protein n=1 Tax=Talaromyces proteolyticus TaxID=1131652 RepID=A0AAD4KVQ3_9EURO|nr:uncharacterized protein BGW36DRAFT_137777 [Talaromyces proteolyticus]KAH8700884.1 hypothetical protein BGW36DRAFT_137777 [Talaromyces proteolyticus]
MTMESTREERLQMRQRGAGTRKIQEVDFGFSFGSPVATATAGSINQVLADGPAARTTTRSPRARTSVNAAASDDLEQRSKQGNGDAVVSPTPGSARVTRRSPPTRGSKQDQTEAEGPSNDQNVDTNTTTDPVQGGESTERETTLRPAQTSTETSPRSNRGRRKSGTDRSTEVQENSAQDSATAESKLQAADRNGEYTDTSAMSRSRRQRTKNTQSAETGDRGKRGSAQSSTEQPDSVGNAKDTVQDRPRRKGKAAATEVVADTGPESVISESRSKRQKRKEKEMEPEQVQNEPDRNTERSRRRSLRNTSPRQDETELQASKRRKGKQKASEPEPEPVREPEPEPVEEEEEAPSQKQKTKRKHRESRSPAEAPRRRGRPSLDKDISNKDAGKVAAEPITHPPPSSTGSERPAKRRRGRPSTDAEQRRQTNPEEKRREGTVAITVHRLANTSALGDASSDSSDSSSDELDTRKTFPSRSGVNPADVLSQICQEILDKHVTGLSNSIANESNQSKRSEAVRQHKAVEAYRSQLEGRLFELSELLESNFAIGVKLKRAKRETMDMRNRLLEVRRQRQEIALRMDAVRLKHGEEEDAKMSRNAINNSLHNLELTLDRNRVPAKTDTASAVAGLEFTLRTVSENVSSAAEGAQGGLLSQVRAFNAQLEMAARKLS